MARPSIQANDREAELIQRVCRGEHEAFYELVRPYERAIYFAAMSVLNNSLDAEEVSQEIVLKAFKAVPNFRFEAKFSTWIIQITINESRMKLRKDRRHLYHPSKRNARIRKAITGPRIWQTGGRYRPKSCNARNCAKHSGERRQNLRPIIQKY